MTKNSRRFAALAMALPFAMIATVADAQNAAHTHIGHVSTGFPAAPDGAGLLATASAEAATAVQHARLAADDPTNLDAAKAHAGHVIHALDPAEGSRGPGKGFGVKRAAEGVAQHIGMAGSAAGASQNVGTHAGHIAAAARGAVARTDAAVAVARQIQGAANYAEVEPLVLQLRTLTQQIAAGVDADGNGTIGFQEAEGGLAQAEQHLTLLRRAEGL